MRQPVGEQLDASIVMNVDVEQEHISVRAERRENPESFIIEANKQQPIPSAGDIPRIFTRIIQDRDGSGKQKVRGGQKSKNLSHCYNPFPFVRVKYTTQDRACQ